jgi:hypothetical protein
MHSGLVSTMVEWSFNRQEFNLFRCNLVKRHYGCLRLMNSLKSVKVANKLCATRIKSRKTQFHNACVEPPLLQRFLQCHEYIQFLEIWNMHFCMCQ